MKEYFIVDKETKHMVGKTMYGNPRIADAFIKKMEGGFKKYAVYAFDLNQVTKSLIEYALLNEQPCVYKQRTR